MFEESKIWVSLFLVGLFISFGFGAHYLSSVDEANLALQESKSKLADMQEQVVLRKRSWDENERIINKLQAEENKNATLLKAKDVLDLRVIKAESDLKYALESMKTAVDKTRTNASGTEHAEITLANGKALRGVKIRKVEENGISLIHTDGIGTISVELLPDNFKEQYDLGPNALIPIIQKDLNNFLAKPEKGTEKKPPSPSPAPATPSHTPKAKSTVDDSKAKKIRLRMAELDARMASYASVLEKYQDAAASHRSLASSAMVRGQPSTRHTENANENLVQAALVERQMASMREERGKLVVELEYALGGK